MALDIKDLGKTAYVDGEWIGAESGLSFDVTNPALPGSVIASVPDLGVAETRRAIEAAHQAWGSWKAKPAKERSKILMRWYNLILAHQKDLAQVMTQECGKPLSEAMTEVVYGASFIEWFAEEAKRVYGETIPAPMPDRRFVVIKQPVGVVTAITPWNFPLAMITRKVAPALAAGCTVVIKPAEDTPLTALLLAKLAEEAEFPKGVLNVITSSQAVQVGKEMTENALVRKVSFTGSTEVGKILMRQCASTVKKVSLELGGNAPFIVFDDADIEAAVRGAIASKYRNTGQTCVCANRFLVQDAVYDAFASRLAQEVGKLKVGNGLDEGITQGPLINQQGFEKVKAHVADAKEKGARVLTGGVPHERGGNFFQPTVLVDMAKDSLIAKEETFGPVAALFRFHTEEEAVQMANDTQYGLAAYFYGRDIGRVWRVAEALEYGIVGINEGVISTEVAPFGGVKESGLGREGSKHGIEDYLELKYLCMGGL